MSIVTDELFMDLLALTEEILDTRSKMIEFLSVTADQLLSGRNQYRVGAVVRSTVDGCEYTNAEQIERVRTIRLRVEEHTNARPSEQGDPRGDADNGR